MKKWKCFRKIASLTCIAALTVAMLSLPVFAVTPVSSDVTIGGVYAIGSCGYSTTSAYATTTHAIVSEKYVSVQGTYVINNKVMRIGTGGYSASTAPAVATVSLPSGATTYIGAKGTHYVFCGDVPWGPKESSIGVQ